MKLKLILVLLLLVPVAYGQQYLNYPYGTTAVDTFIGKNSDTTNAIDVWGSVNRPKPGMGSWNFLFDKTTGSAYGHDSIIVALYGTNRGRQERAGEGWGFLQAFDLWEYGYSLNVRGDSIAIYSRGEDICIPADSLVRHSFRHVRWVLDGATGEDVATCSTKYRVIYGGDKGTQDSE